MISKNGSDKLPLEQFASQTLSLSPELPFSDQRGGLKTLGAVLMVLGSFSGCLGVTSLGGIRIRGSTALPPAEIASALFMVLLAAWLLISVGATSLRLRRAARPYVLIVTATWAIMGLRFFVSSVLFASDVDLLPAAATQPSDRPTVSGRSGVMSVVSGGFMLVFMIVLPMAIFWFYRRPSVRQTLEHFDNNRSWTDYCPTPVLAVAFWLALGALFTMNFCFWGIFPLFGTLVHGPVAIGLLISTAFVLLALAGGMLRLSAWAWWGTLAVAVLGAASTIVTFARVDPLEFYRLAGLAPEQIEAIRRLGANLRATMLISPVFYGLAFTGYLLWIKQYFLRPHTPAENSAANSRETA